MKTLLMNALSTSTTNAFNNSGEMLKQAGVTAGVALVSGTAIAAKKTSDFTAKAAEKCEAASQSMTRWLLKHVPVEKQ